MNSYSKIAFYGKTLFHRQDNATKKKTFQNCTVQSKSLQNKIQAFSLPQNVLQNKTREIELITLITFKDEWHSKKIKKYNRINIVAIMLDEVRLKRSGRRFWLMFGFLFYYYHLCELTVRSTEKKKLLLYFSPKDSPLITVVVNSEC